MVADYQNNGQPDDTSDRAAAVAAVVLWLAGWGLNPAPAIADQLAGLHTDAYHLGTASGTAVVDGTPLNLDGWQPGDTAAARQQIADAGQDAGLDELLAAAADTADGIGSSRLEDAARSLLNDTAAGVPADDMAANLLAALTDPGRAEAVAVTETVAASSAAAAAVYAARGVDLGQWVIDPTNPCPVCVANSEADPRPIGEAWPSGAVEPPQHPRCRCGLVPASEATISAGAAAAALAEEVSSEAEAAEELTFDERIAEAAAGEDALASATVSRVTTSGRELLTDRELRALYDYGGWDYGRVNRGLRGTFGLTLDTETRSMVRAMDKALNRPEAALTQDITVWRGASFRPEFFGDRFNGNLTGFTWRDKAYASTSASQRQAEIFASGDRAVLMRILVPAGQHVVQLSGTDAEWELLLKRGLKFRVVADRGFDPRGSRLLDVEIVP